MKPIVSYQNVTKTYGDLEVLQDIDFDIYPGEKVALIGPSGSGKTTLARLLMTLERPDSGSILVNGENLWQEEVKGKLVKAKEKHLHEMRKQIGMVFQHFYLFPHMNVLDNITEAPKTVLGVSKEEAEQDAVEMLKKVGLEDKLEDYPAQLSGGQKQRVAIARALVMKPNIMLFDEPTSALDPELVGEVLDIIKEIAAGDDMTMLLITHEMEFAREVADRLAFFNDGVIAEQGEPEEMINNPKTPRLQSFLSRVSA